MHSVAELTSWTRGCVYRNYCHLRDDVNGKYCVSVCLSVCLCVSVSPGVRKISQQVMDEF